MDLGNVRIAFHPAFCEAVTQSVELEEKRLRAAAVLGPDGFGRVREIIESEELRKRAAFYETIAEAACAGEDFSKVESIRDIGNIYARFVVRRAFRE